VLFLCSLTVAGDILVNNRAYPNIAADDEATFAKLARMHADIVLTSHPEVADVLGRRCGGRLGMLGMLAPASGRAEDRAPSAADPDRAAERFAMLRERADFGMEMARALQGEVRARAEAAEDADPSEPPRSVAELGLAFSRVSRAVRQTLALEARLEDDRLARERAAEAAEEAQSQSTSEISEAAARVRARIARIFADADAREAAEAGDADRDDLREDLSDGPDVERGEGFVADRPAADVVAGVCGDLGLERDLGLWADEDGAAVPAARGTGVVGVDRRGLVGAAAAIGPPRPDDPRGRSP